MGFATPRTAGDATTLIQQIISKTRPQSVAELYQALNYGIGKAVRAISAVRPQLFSSWVDPFVLQANVKEYDISNLSPPLLRPYRIIVDGGSGQGSVILFRYASMTSAEFEDAECSAGGSVANVLHYETLDGLLPSGVSLALQVQGTPGDTTLQFAPADAAQILRGNLLQVPMLGDATTSVGWQIPVAEDFTTYVLGVDLNTGVVTIQPEVQSVIPPGTQIAVMRSRILRIVPALGQSFSGRLYYVYDPPRMQRDSDPLPRGIARHIDLVVSYAVALLKRSMDDSMEARWQLDATEMRAEMMQDEDPNAAQNTEAFGSALDGVVGY